MPIPSPLYVDPLATDPELLGWLRDTILQIERSQDRMHSMQLPRLEWFIRERIAEGIEKGVELKLAEMRQNMKEQFAAESRP